MGVRPPGLVRPRPDNTSSVESVGIVDRSDSANIRSRTKLRGDEDRITFGTVFDEEDSLSPFVIDPISPETEVSLIVFETGMPMPFTPAAGQNLITTRVTTSFRSPCKLKAYVNDQLQSTVWIQAGGWDDVQIAELAEVLEFVDALDGTNDIEFTIENTGSVELEGSVLIRTLQQGVQE